MSEQTFYRLTKVYGGLGVGERRSCLALGVDRSSVRYVSVKPDQAPLRLRIHDLARTRVRYGYYRIYILLRREGWFVNHKRVYRLYREDGLSLRLKHPRRHVSAASAGGGAERAVVDGLRLRRAVRRPPAARVNGR